MKSIISSKNKQILTPKNKQVGCGCRVKNPCPLDNKCLISQLLYQVVVTNNFEDKYKYYLEYAETSFKERYGNHKSSFKNENSKNSTGLSKYVWSCTSDDCQTQSSELELFLLFNPTNHYPVFYLLSLSPLDGMLRK